MAAQESTWLIQLMKDLNQPIDYAVPLYCDNQFTIRLAENPVFHARTKHVEVHYHFLREKVLQEELEMRQVKTEEQVADLFTKALNTTRFQKLRDQLNMYQRTNFDESVLRGSIEKSAPPLILDLSRGVQNVKVGNTTACTFGAEQLEPSSLNERLIPPPQNSSYFTKAAASPQTFAAPKS